MLQATTQSRRNLQKTSVRNRLMHTRILAKVPKAKSAQLIAMQRASRSNGADANSETSARRSLHQEQRRTIGGHSASVLKLKRASTLRVTLVKVVN